MARGGRGGRRGGGRVGAGGGRSGSGPPHQSILAGDGARGAHTDTVPSTQPSLSSTPVDTSLQSIQAPLPPPDRSVEETPASSSSQVPPDPIDPVLSSSFAESSSGSNLLVIRVICDRLIPSNTIAHKMTHIFKTMIHEDGYAWKNIPESYIRTYYEEFQKHFTWDPAIDAKVKELWHKQAARRYSGMISKMKEKRTTDDKPSCVPVEIWRRWKDYWDTPEVIAKSEQQRKNRYSEVSGPGTGCSLHTGGTKSFVEHKIAMEKKLGRTPTEFEFFESTHTTHDGDFVDDRSKLIAAEVKRRATELTQATEGSAEAPNLDMSQLYLDVVGGSKKQRVYGLGSLAPTFTTSSASNSSSATSSLDQDALRKLQEQMEQTFGAQMEAQKAQIAQMEAQMAQMAQREAQREAQMQARMQAQLQEMMQQMLRTGIIPPAVQTHPGDGTANSSNADADLGGD